tara:strand:+ start:261 stop:605 length:345 start_codon:yes stop_codon:yes gene_type:complete
MDAFFNALKAKFQKGGTVKKRPTGAKIDTTGKKAAEAKAKGRGMAPPKDPKFSKENRRYTAPADTTPATPEDKARVKEKAKKIGGIKGQAAKKKMYGGSMKKKRMYGGSKKKMY